jgi:hypothetical protein
MTNNFSPVPPFNAAIQYFDSKTPSGLTQAGYRQFAQLQAVQGVAPTVTAEPTGTASPGAFVFNPSTNLLHVYNGTKWVSVQLL